ncbi:flagellar biosynthesis anti-sigma factor FlgM [Photobacterium sp. BZF1]|uniref:flagellar biosynthesis anti-sigma factor FlgM n=1 Tax=Photobacterium sp. BZF1 TaxID=1904457 RepID=UPI0016538D6B|nr:flagellar biosynthesis anti-sigma factor FlgM [Photobacterium sp. BZF1]MBC7001612.1 flagellar biosynthesis anti-sigma factor FlgM [Photobacterium sp. BZF1]
MSQFKVDNIKPILPQGQVDVVQSQQVKPEPKQGINSVSLSQHELELIESTDNLFAELDDIDLDKVAQLKAQLASGELEFDMDELAKALVRLDHDS